MSFTFCLGIWTQASGAACTGFPNERNYWLLGQGRSACISIHDLTQSFANLFRISLDVDL